MHQLIAHAETLSNIAYLLGSGNIEQAQATAAAALARTQLEIAEYEAWLEGQAEAEAAWAIHGDALARDLNSYPEAVEEIPF